MPTIRSIPKKPRFKKTFASKSSFSVNQEIIINKQTRLKNPILLKPLRTNETLLFSELTSKNRTKLTI